MELWLLAAGAVLLVAIAAWVTWPAEPEEMISMSSNPEMPDPQEIPPQGDRFEAQYTSATGDLSAGGVAEAFAQPEPAGPELGQPGPGSSARPASDTPARAPSEPAARPASDTGGRPASDTPDRYAPPPVATGASTGAAWSQPSLPREGTGDRYQTPVATSHSYPAAPVESERSLPGMVVPAAAALTVGGAVAGAWFYAWWQERNKPVNRLRRRARDVASRLPDIDDLPSGAGPRGGAAAAVLLTSLALARALRSGSDDEPETDQEAAEEQRQRALRALDRLPWRELVASVDWSSLMQGVPSADDVRGRGKRLLQDGPSMDDVRGRARRFARDLPGAGDLRKGGKRMARRLPSMDDLQDEQARPAVFGLGFGGVAAVLAASYLVWRVLRGT